MTIGQPTPNNTVYMLDDELRPCPIGQIGEMWAGGDCVSVGYLGNPRSPTSAISPIRFSAVAG